MKTIYSLQEFRNEVLKIAASVNENYTNVRVLADHEGAVTFECYIHTYDWHKGSTMESSLQSLKDRITPPPVANVDVEIDIETEIPELVNEEKESKQPEDLPF